MAITLIKSMSVFYGNSERKVSLYSGDLSTLGSADGVTYLGVSALPNDYSPTTGSLINSLNQKGIVVGNLAKNKLADYRPDIPCWVSKDISSVGFKRIVVFEPNNPSTMACDLVSYMFSAVRAAQGSDTTPVSLALPLVSTGSGKANTQDMMDAMFYAASHWCGMKFPFSEIKIVLLNATDVLKSRFDMLIQQYNGIESIDLQNYSIYASEARSYIKQKVLPNYLTYRQAFGMCVYTSGFYLTINSILRENNRSSDRYKKIRPLMEAIDTGLMNIAPYTGTSYRGEGAMSPQRQRENEKGKIVTNLSYTSSSYQPTSYFNRQNRFKFASLTGAVIENYSLYPVEKEVLFADGMRYLVNNVEKNGGYTMYTCEEVQQKYRR